MVNGGCARLSVGSEKREHVIVLASFVGIPSIVSSGRQPFERRRLHFGQRLAKDLPSDRHFLAGFDGTIDCDVRRGLDEVGEIGARIARRGLGERLQAQLAPSGAVLDEDLEDADSGLPIRRGNEEDPIEATRPAKCGVDRPRYVRGPQHQHALILAGKPVHLGQELADQFRRRALTGVLALTSQCLHLVEEENARRTRTRALEQRVEFLLRFPDVHLEDIGDLYVEKGRIAFARGGSGEQRLAASRRPVEQNASADLFFEALKEARLLKGKHDPAVNLALDRLESTHVLERDPIRRGEEQTLDLRIGGVIVGDDP